MNPLTLGRLRVDRIVERDTIWFDTRAFYPSLDEAGIAHFQRTLGPRLMHPQTGHIALSFHSYLIRTPELTILVDTCNGAHKPRTPKVAWQDRLPEGEYLGNLARAGVRPEDVDLVMCTHLHCDHVGWNTRLVDGRWVPTFPNARYLMAREEFEHFDRLHRAGPDYPVNHGAWEDSVLPVVASGQARIVEMRHQVEGDLARAGVRPEDVDLVMCTHLHCDHVGWNTRLVDGRWVPTFPNARYLMAREEFEHFDRLHRAGPDYPVNHGAWEDSVLPVVASGQARIVEMRHQVEGDLGDGVWMEPAPGHTPGHVTVHLRAPSGEAILSGDILHHPISMALPDLSMYADWNPDLGRATRRALLERCADTSTLLLTGHFPAPTAGHVVSAGDAFAFRFVGS